MQGQTVRIVSQTIRYIKEHLHRIFTKTVVLTTYCAEDKADTGWREEYCRLGFAEWELLVKYGYPTQRFVLPPKKRRKQGMTETQKNPLAEGLSSKMCKF